MNQSKHFYPVIPKLWNNVLFNVFFFCKLWSMIKKEGSLVGAAGINSESVCHMTSHFQHRDWNYTLFYFFYKVPMCICNGDLWIASASLQQWASEVDIIGGWDTAPLDICMPLMLYSCPSSIDQTKYTPSWKQHSITTVSSFSRILKQQTKISPIHWGLCNSHVLKNLLPKSSAHLQKY